jgi:hypothetical protein
LDVALRSDSVAEQMPVDSSTGQENMEMDINMDI